MIELNNNELIIRFPEIEEVIRSKAQDWFGRLLVGATADELKRLGAPEVFLKRILRRYDKLEARVSFKRTLRIPDDGKEYPLPPSFGNFPLRHVDDFQSAPADWHKSGGVMLPMHRAEAMWIEFQYPEYPMIMRIAAGSICAVSGLKWASGLSKEPQNFVSLERQPWLDGFRVGQSMIRQFVAAPLGKGLTVENQLTGHETWGGLQLQAYPLKVDAYLSSIKQSIESAWHLAVMPLEPIRAISRCTVSKSAVSVNESNEAADLGLGAGGTMRQEIFQDSRDLSDWDTTTTSRCYVRLCLADDWKGVTGEPCPHSPPSVQDYTRAGLPWFSYESDTSPVTGLTDLSAIKSVNTLLKEKVGFGLDQNQSVTVAKVKAIKSNNPLTVREF